ncbi:MAG: helix-turn-helix domain-containing protein [Rhodopila sp.]|jgi:AraC-like DNA-binding protein
MSQKSNRRPEPVVKRSVPTKADLESLVTSMEVEVAALTECFVGSGWKLSFPAAKLPAIHYALSGCGRMTVVRSHSFALRPHTLVIMPPGRAFHIEGGEAAESGGVLKSREARVLLPSPDDKVQTFRAGDDAPQVSVICGYFRASYGLSIDIFSTLRSPIVEQFEDLDHLASHLKIALTELSARRVGMKAVTASILKQVFVALLRRSLASIETWTDRFAIFADPQIARAFADMVEVPGGQHSVQSLAKAAGLSRSAFMQRFQHAIGQPPMLALREIRMRHAAKLLETQALTIDQVARAVGFNSRSSFSRAFRRAHGFDPKTYRATAGASKEE